MQTSLYKIIRQCAPCLLLLAVSSGIRAQVNFSLPSNTTAGNITRAEYFIDTDPGFGSGTAFSITPAQDLSGTYSVNLNGLQAGSHRVYIRTQDAAKHWSLVSQSPFYVVPPAFGLPSNPVPGNVVKAEYFFDTDPGFGSGTNIPVTAATDLSGSYAVNTGSLSNGSHHVYLRTMDAANHWSLVSVASFYIVAAGFSLPSNATPGNIVKAEYFFDTDPGFGSGTAFTITAGTDITASNVAVGLNGLSNGSHRLYLRTKDASGRWSLVNYSVFNIVVANVSIPSNPVAGNITKLEYFFDTDPGFGNGKTVSFAGTTDLSNYTFAADLTGLKVDTSHTLYVRTFDAWSTTVTRTFLLGSALPVTWLSFTAQLQADSVLLNWQTATESNNARYDIERSADGTAFTGIGRVSGNGSTALTHAYRFVDVHPLEGVSYYRIKQVDIDGHFTYSVVIKINVALASSVRVYPNPARDVVNIVFDKVQPANAQLRLFTNSGQLLQTVGIGGLQQKQLAVSQLPAGIYQAEIRAGNTVIIKQLIISR